MKTLYKQYNLQSGDHHLTAWLDSIKLKVGTKLTLDDSEASNWVWTVKGIGDTILHKNEIKGSHNSKS